MVGQPGRVAALIGSFADVWCLAGGQNTLVAAAHDAWTSFDLGLSDTVADLGAVKEPNLEVLLAAQPDFILASCNTTADLELESTFENAGIPAAYFDIQSFDDYLNMLKICTDLTGCPENYETYGLQVQEQVEAARMASRLSSSSREALLSATLTQPRSESISPRRKSWLPFTLQLEPVARMVSTGGAEPSWRALAASTCSGT